LASSTAKQSWTDMRCAQTDVIDAVQKAMPSNVTPVMRERIAKTCAR
jgi:hypothetical protein